VTAIDRTHWLPALRACASAIRPLEAGSSLLIDCELPGFTGVKPVPGPSLSPTIHRYWSGVLRRWSGVPYRCSGVLYPWSGVPRWHGLMLPALRCRAPGSGSGCCSAEH
jgi:hypothetical protein